MTNAKRVLTVLLLVMLVAAVGYAREKTSYSGYVKEVSTEEHRLVVNIEDDKEFPTGELVTFSDPKGKLKSTVRPPLTVGKHVFVRFEIVDGVKVMNNYRVLPPGPGC